MALTAAEGSLRSFKRIKSILDAMGITPKNMVEADPTNLSHILWMCNHCIEQLKRPSGMSVDKFSRWLGFIQCALVFHGITTVKNERDMVRQLHKGNT